MTKRAFTKMHGLGNDFIVIDARDQMLQLSDDQVRALADRRRGIGCDQLIVLEPSTRADLFMRIFNADGSQVSACGNATRCVGRALLEDHGKTSAIIETGAGLLTAANDENPQWIAVDMGTPLLQWNEIPLAHEADTLSLDIECGPLKSPVAVSMGNPHAVFVVDDVSVIDIEQWGPQLEHHPLFPEKANIGILQVKDRANGRLRVWERGSGLTLACGTGACAAVVAGIRRGLFDRKVTLQLDGGEISIEWRSSDQHVIMSGPAEISFTGEIEI